MFDTESDTRANRVASLRRLVDRMRRFEKLANSLTHGIGVPLGIAALTLLVVFASLRGTAIHVVTCAVFGTAVVLLYGASTLYHSTSSAKRRRIYRILDHACIYVLIAGTYTPFALARVGGAWGWSLFGIVWGIAAFGVVLKIFFTGRFDALSTASYLAMGWLAVIAIEPTLEAIPPGGIAWLLAGGLSYTAGVLFYAFDERIPFGHAIWHLFVLLGTTMHFFAVLLYVIPEAAS